MSGASSKFDAGDVVEPLEWDFSKFGAGSGTVPEPTDKVYNRFIKRIQKIVRDSGMKELAALAAQGNGIDPVVAMEAMTRLPEGALEQVEEQMVEAISEFTAGSPSKEQILALPMRPRQAFYGWLMGQFSPKTSATGTNSIPVATPNGESASLSVVT